MSRALVLLLALLVVSPLATAGSASDPELDDPDNDNTATAGDCSPVPVACSSGAPTPHDAAEITAIWVTEPDLYNVTLHLQTAAAGDGDTKWTVQFNVTPTPTSIHTGSPEHTVVFGVTGTTLAAGAPTNTTVVRNGNVLEVTFNKTEIDAVGGDSITAIIADVEDTSSEAGTGPNSRPVTSVDSAGNGTDTRPFVLFREPIVAGARLNLTGGSITDLQAPLTTTFLENGTKVVSGNRTLVTTTFNGTEADVKTGDALVVYEATIQNTGTDPDDVTVALFDPTGTLAAAGIDVTLNSAQGMPANITGTGLNFTLLPGEMASFTLAAQLNGTDAGAHTLLLSASTTRGAVAATAGTVFVPTQPLPTAVDPTPAPSTPTTPGGSEEPTERKAAAGLGFLSPLAEAMGLDEVFGEWAELVLLAIILLLLILIIFLVLMLVGRSSLRLDIEPRMIDAAPGQTVDFDVHLANKKGRAVAAVARFEGDPEWDTSLEFGAETTGVPGVDADLNLGPKETSAGARPGRLHVTVPAAADAKETDRVTVTVAALDENGREKGRRKATVKIRAAGASKTPVRLASVQHDPDHPAAGQTVETSAHLENDSDEGAQHLRVVLNVDGDDVQEQIVVIGPRQAREVIFRWQVPVGASKVKVRVYPVD